jgi:hypothetical protein
MVRRCELPKENNKQTERLSEVKKLWAAAYTIQGPTDKTVQALALGRNFRINIAKALEAAYASAKVFLEGVKIHAGLMTTVDWIGLGPEVIHAFTAAYGALVESMLPLDYVACVVLSGYPNGVTEKDLRQEVEKFLKNPKAKKLPWYLGMSERNIRSAADSTKQADWFERLLDRLRKDDWLTVTGATLKFKSRNIELGIKFS